MDLRIGAVATLASDHYAAPPPPPRMVWTADYREILDGDQPIPLTCLALVVQSLITRAQGVIDRLQSTDDRRPSSRTGPDRIPVISSSTPPWVKTGWCFALVDFHRMTQYRSHTPAIPRGELSVGSCSIHEGQITRASCSPERLGFDVASSSTPTTTSLLLLLTPPMLRRTQDDNITRLPLGFNAGIRTYTLFYNQQGNTLCLLESGLELESLFSQF